ncbi:hypothetical protein SASPL_142542 [Salvia splendens]|uniref:Uncharacterized protein n=1 Tax=Salvia splendens TaxID=180675 RepID=A0A8X8WL25_SALSN|nr:hypothetical protein SASPL_142542 [Salvia splendens]
MMLFVALRQKINYIEEKQACLLTFFENNVVCSANDIKLTETPFSNFLITNKNLSPHIKRCPYSSCRSSIRILIEVEPTGKASNVELPGTPVSHPSVTLLGRVAIVFPNGVRKQLHQLLRLRVAVGIAGAVWLLHVLGVARCAVVVIGSIREVGSVVSVYLGVVLGDVVRGAVADVGGAAPRLSCWVDDHLRVPGHVGLHIAVARGAAVFPAAPYVHQVELALRTSPFLDVQTQFHFEIWGLWQNFEHSSSVIMVAPRISFCCISSQVKHKPWILIRSLQLMIENPTPTPNFLLPHNFIIRASIGGIRTRVVTPVESASQQRPVLIQPGWLVVQGRLIHTPLPETRKSSWLKRWRLFPVLRAQPGSGIVVSILEHHHPKLPRLQAVGDLT